MSKTRVDRYFAPGSEYSCPPRMLLRGALSRNPDVTDRLRHGWQMTPFRELRTSSEWRDLIALSVMLVVIVAMLIVGFPLIPATFLDLTGWGFTVGCVALMAGGLVRLVYWLAGPSLVEWDLIRGPSHLGPCAIHISLEAQGLIGTGGPYPYAARRRVNKALTDITLVNETIWQRTGDPDAEIARLADELDQVEKIHQQQQAKASA